MRVARRRRTSTGETSEHVVDTDLPIEKCHPNSENTMTDRNRSNDSEGSRRAYDDAEQQRRRDRQDEWRREHPGERSFGRDDAYGRENRGYGAGGSGGGPQEYGQERGGYGGGGQGYGSQRYGEQRYGERDSSQRYGQRDSDNPGVQRYGGGQDYGSQRYGQDYGDQRHGQDDGSQRYGRQDYGSQRYGGSDYESQRHSGVGHSGLTSSSQHDEREGLYNRSEFGTPQYGAFGITEGGRQGREWQQLGGMRGEHRGKGPKGYKRSDDRIREDVCDRLSDDDELDASEITVSVKDGEVTLEGSVTDRRSKQRAEDLAESVGGVRDVDNKLRKNKGILQEMGDRLAGSQNNERGGYAGSGTKNTPPNASMSR